MKILLILWQLPQSLVFWSMYVFLYFRKEVLEYYWDENLEIYVLTHSNSFLTSCGLGLFMIIADNQNNTIMRLHEKGHCRQSLYLGWLYLLIVGLPSVILNLTARKNETVNKNYYNYFPENWADKLGGVER